MAKSGVYYGGKELLVCQLDQLSPSETKAALSKTSARGKRELVEQFTETAGKLRQEAEPYLATAAHHDNESNIAAAGVAGILELRGHLGTVGQGLFNEAVEHRRERRHNIRLATPFTSGAEVYESAASKLRWGARKDEFIAVVHKAAAVAKSVLHMS